MNIKVDFDNIVVKEDKNDFNVKVLMLKGEKGDAGSGEANVIEKVQVNGVDLPVTNKTVNVSVPTVDSALSSSSTNPVQNNTIYNALGNKVDNSSLDNYYETSEVDDLLNAKANLSSLDNYYAKTQTYNKTEIDALNSSLSSQISSLANGSPLVASSTSEMTDTTKVYVNTTDGKWYYYDGSGWEIGGIYQATEIPDNSVTPEKTTFFDISTTNLINFNEFSEQNLNGVFNETTEIYSIENTANASARHILGYFDTDSDTSYVLKVYKINSTDTKPAIYVCDSDTLTGTATVVYTYGGSVTTGLAMTLQANTRYYIQPYVALNNGNYDFRIKVEKADVYTEDYNYKTKKIEDQYLPNTENELIGKKLSICGVSIDTYQGYIPNENSTYYTPSNLPAVGMTWWKKLLNKTGMELLINNSWNGATVTTQQSLASSGVQRCINLDDGVSNPDFIIVGAFGLNDWIKDADYGTYNVTDSLPGMSVDLSNSSNYTTYQNVIEKFEPALATMFLRIQQKYPNAKIFAMDSYPYYRDGANPIGSNTKNIYNINQCLYKVAGMFGIEVIKISDCGINSSNSRSYCVEGLNSSVAIHPNDEGHTFIYKKALEHFKKYL